MEPIVPMPSIYYPDFIAANQGDRANNVIPGADKKQHLEHIRQDIRNFKEKHDLECVIVLWTANTERYTDVTDGLNMTAEQVLASIEKSADEHNVFVGGDDFKSGQTKIKSALVDFLVSSGLKPESIVSYNHLGNN
ncbi:unnamed protein product, partial [Strongylus vulgaris]